MDVEGGEQAGGAVAAILELLAHRDPRHPLVAVAAGGDRWACRVDPALGLDPGLLIDRPHQGVVGRVQVETADVTGLLPELGVVAGHPRLHLPWFEIKGAADPPRLRRRDRHSLFGHPGRQGVHRPARCRIRRIFGHGLDEQQHVVVAVRRRSTRAVTVQQAGQPISREPLTPDADLVEMHADALTDRPVRHPIGGQQHDAGPLRHPRLDGVRTHTALQLDALLIADLQRK